MNKIRFLILASITFYVSPILAQMEGDGTEKNPYLVKTPEDLFDVRMELSAHYKLINDIDLTEWIKDESPKQGWTPIGTETTPFTGIFDGNNKTIKGLYINKSDVDNVGLFGYLKKGTIKNVSLINPIVLGKNGVGAIVGGGCSTQYYNISNNICVGGRIEGESFIGGVAGRMTGVDGTSQNICFVKGNYSSSSIIGNTVCGGIIGEICGYNQDYHSAYTNIHSHCYPFVDDNHFEGTIYAKSIVGGIVGEEAQPNVDWYYGPTLKIETKRNIAQGTIIGNTETNGILGKAPHLSVGDNSFVLIDNVCAADTISGTDPYRVFSNAYPNNYAFISTIVIRNGKIVDVEDDDYNGSGLGLRTLKRKNTYVGMGFDFDEQWAISEGESFPYNINQSAPPAITSCMTIGGNTIVSGTAPADGTIYVFVGDKMYEGNITNGNWDVMLSKLPKGTKIKASADTDSKMPSIFVSFEIEDGAGPDIDAPVDSIYVRPASAVRGSKAPLYICLKNEQMATNYSFDLVLPEGLGIDSYVLSSRDSGHSLSMNLEEGTGVYNISVEANPSKEIKGNDGTVFVLMVNTSNLPCGKHFVTIKNAKYSAVSVTAPIVLPDTKAILKIEETTWGDLNGDGLVNISDIMTIIEIMVKQLKK
ncbi:MAG: hypothetical protein IKR50_04390 [Prevotella sp.]|nr:hypothetical protein [Prevotella sp.]